MRIHNMFVKLILLLTTALFLMSCQTEPEKFQQFFDKWSLESISKGIENIGEGTTDRKSLSTEQHVLDVPNEKAGLPLQYMEFVEKNAKYNVKLAVLNHPEIKSQSFMRKMATAGIGMAEAAKDLQISGSLLTGAKSENSQTEASAVANLSVGRVLYDYGSSDYAIASQKEAVRSAELSEKIAVEKIALEAYKAWINLAKSHEIEKVFKRGIDLATPLLGQIRNISTSGISDKAGLLAAQQKFASLEIGYAKTKSSTLAAKAIFDDVFQLSGAVNVVALDPIKLQEKHKNPEDSFSAALDIQANQSILNTKSLELKALKATSNPQVYFRANASLPAENMREDGIATVGVDVSYNFNDGGFKESQMEMIRFEMDSIREKRNELMLVKMSTFKVLEQQYQVAIKRIKSAEELLNLASEVRSTVKAQLVSGRSSIQDVMDAEVTFSESEIELSTSTLGSKGLALVETEL